MANRLIDRFGTTMLRFSRRSTVHGVNHIAQARNAQRRIFWLFISFSASLGFLINMFYLLQKFWQTPILTNLYHDSDPFVYPDITFCQINPMYFPPKESAQSQSFEKYLAYYHKKKEEFPGSHFLMSDHIFISKNLSYVHPKWSSILYCQYMGLNCSGDHFDYHAIWPYNSCYTFNLTKLTRATRTIHSSRSRGLFKPDFRVVVYKALNYPTQHQNNPHGGIFMPSGILLMVHEPGTSPFIGNNVIIDGGTQIEIKVKHVQHLASLGKCKTKKVNYTYVDLFTNSTHEYIGRRHDCQTYLVQMALAKHCNCQHMGMFRPSVNRDLDFCNHSHYKCMNIVSKSNIKDCFADQCEHMSIRRVIAQTSYPAVLDRYSHTDWLKALSELERRERQHFGGKSDLAEKALTNSALGDCSWAAENSRKDLLNISFVERNFMMFRIIPASLYMDRVVETEEYPLSRLFSDIGGCVGLWIGASLITIFECVDLLLDVFDSLTMNREPTKEISNESDIKLTQSLLRKHTAQTYILGGKPIWEEMEEDHLMLHSNKETASSKPRPPTPPFYHLKRPQQLPMSNSTLSYESAPIPIFVANDHSTNKK